MLCIFEITICFSEFLNPITHIVMLELITQIRLAIKKETKLSFENLQYTKGNIDDIMDTEIIGLKTDFK